MNDNPESPRQDALRDARKQITRSLFMALAALGVIVFACYAWFANNTSVTGMVDSVRLNGSLFELASVGNSGSQYSESTPEAYTVEEGEAWEKDNSTTGTSTAGKSKIVWRLDGSSHLNNIQDEQGIRPGSFGTLQFYVIPKLNGSLNLQFDLELIPVLNSNYQDLSETDATTLNQLMHGHMLFSYQCKNVSILNRTLIDLENPSFTLNFENVERDKEILVTLKWIWPYVLDDVKGNNLNEVCNGASIVSLMKTIPSYFFYNEGNEFTSPISDEVFENGSQDYNNYFNAADQYLGERINWLIVRMTAQTA